MLLNQSQFDKKFKDNKLKLAFVGMSNIGKSFRAEELQKEKDFSCASIDTDICKELKVGESEENLAKWLGFPYDNEFQQKQEQYLKIEDTLIKNIKAPKNKNFVIDTTGSAIYLPNKTLQSLKDNFLIIHFKVPDVLLDTMIENYFSRPKPIIWGNIFNKKKGESEKEALKRCYPELLNFREKKYQALADISINFFKKTAMAHKDFWKLLKNSLK